MTQIVSGSNDGSVCVWNVSSGLELKELKGLNSLVASVMFSSDCTRILSCSDDGLQVWDASTDMELQELNSGHTGWVLLVMCSSVGMQIISGSDDGSVQLWEVWS